IEALEDAFIDFVGKTPFLGVAVMCLDHPRVQAILPRCDKRIVTYGLSPQADYRAERVRPAGLAMQFDAIAHGHRLGEVTLRMPGAHNVANALAVLAVADFLQIPFDVYQAALASFGGVGRRFTVRGEAASVMVVDDYGHHPAEV